MNDVFWKKIGVEVIVFSIDPTFEVKKRESKYIYVTPKFYADNDIGNDGMRSLKKILCLCLHMGGW